jgi:hypothetical protein
MKSLIWKEWRENLIWAPLPGLVVLVMFLIDRPLTPMPEVSGALLLCLTAAVFGAALGFVQVFPEAHGDKRSVLLHRPISRSRIFLAKVIAGISLYLVALGTPFLVFEWWKATPGKMAAPYHWRTSLPWLADILTGLVYYFAGMLVAQRDVRWYGSRGLALVAALMSSYLVWIVPEFGHALPVIGTFVLVTAVAAYGNFCTGGAYPPLPRYAKATLALTFLAALLSVSIFGKLLIGEVFDSGIEYHYELDRQGRLLLEGFKPGVGQVGDIVSVDQGSASAPMGRTVRKALAAFMETPIHGSYRHSGRFYVPCKNDSVPSQEIWYFDQKRRLLVGYDMIMHQSLGSFGPDGFSQPGQPAGAGFAGNLLYRSERWHGLYREYLALPEAVYAVNFSKRTIRKFFTPSAGEVVTFADRWEDLLDLQRTAVVVSTSKSFHFLTVTGTPLISVPRVFERQTHGHVHAGPLEGPARYYVWYQARQRLLEPDELRSLPGYLLEYDTLGHEIARRTAPPVPCPPASHAEALFGLVTPMTEAAVLIAATRLLRSEERAAGSTSKSVFLRNLETSSLYIPGTSSVKAAPTGLIPGYVGLILLSASASALACYMLARRSAFSRARRSGWALLGFITGWVGLVLMLALQEWPARIACPKCRKLRVVSRTACEHCGAAHAGPALDGTEIIERADRLPGPTYNQDTCCPGSSLLA